MRDHAAASRSGAASSNAPAGRRPRAGSRTRSGPRGRTAPGRRSTANPCNRCGAAAIAPAAIAARQVHRRHHVLPARRAPSRAVSTGGSALDAITCLACAAARRAASRGRRRSPRTPAGRGTAPCRRRGSGRRARSARSRCAPGMSAAVNTSTTPGSARDGVERQRRQPAMRHRRQAERRVQGAGELGHVVDVGGLAGHVQVRRLVRGGTPTPASGLAWRRRRCGPRRRGRASARGLGDGGFVRLVHACRHAVSRAHTLTALRRQRRRAAAFRARSGAAGCRPRASR